MNRCFVKDKNNQDLIQVSGSIPISSCSHIWIIDPPKGKYSKGTCRECNQKRDFDNYLQGTVWRNDVLLEELVGNDTAETSIAKIEKSAIDYSTETQ